MTFSPSDVFVIGGGPVGLAAAIAARRKGLRVTLADALAPPIDKACGEGILPDGIAAAADLGLQLPAAASVNLRGIRFHGEGFAVAADFPERSGRGIRRTTLHRALVDHAESCGVNMHWQCSIGSIKDIDAPWIVGADGAASRLRSWAGMGAFRRDTRRYGFRLHFKKAPWTEYIEIHWGQGCQVYVTPVAPDEVGVALISQDPKLRVEDALSQFPALAANLANAPRSSTERGALTATRRLHRVTGRAGHSIIALIGDASGSVDAISGEGLCLGFRQAIALSDAIDQRNPAYYESAHRRLSRHPRFMADFMLTMDRRQWLRRRVLSALAAHPPLFGRFLAMHVGAAGHQDFAATCFALGWKILTS